MGNHNVVSFVEYRKKMWLKDNIEVTINEFEKFTEFIESEKPVLSAKKGVLGKKDSFKLNGILSHKRNVSAPNYNQDQYPVIELMFSLALAGRLYVRANDDRGKSVLLKTPVLESYRCLNPYEKYVYLLQTYWTKYDFDTNFSPWSIIDSLRNLLVSITGADVGQRIVKDDHNFISKLYSVGAPVFHHLNFFGFGELELIAGAKGTHEDSIRAFIPNNFGIYTSQFLLWKAFLTLNSKNTNIFLTLYGKELKPGRDKNPFKIFKQMFPKKVNRTVVAESEFDRTGVYTFKVSFSKRIWRKISISHKHSLHHLHMAIQEAFDFDDDHLYAFYVEGNRRTGKPIYCAEAESENVTAEETIIADLGLYKGQELLYLFDFGDKLEFNVKLLSIDKDLALPEKPVVVEDKGESPEQYPIWE
ncbi:MAG: plasmid pRiA4b ORF-3 family protein [Firmicutes bacterium]|nr:plasmid pRiA4b ORF-3 family protein [Bacillota bacterium]